MSRSYISEELRRQVRQRARARCEYCLIAEADSIFGCEIDHIVAEKHGGATSYDNLAYSCLLCNRSKGSDLGSILDDTGMLVRFYNPRVDLWTAHFRLDESGSGSLTPLTDIGTVTAAILGFNTYDRRMERIILRDLGTYLLPDEQEDS